MLFWGKQVDGKTYVKLLVGLVYTATQILLSSFINKLKSRNSKMELLLPTDVVNLILPDVSMVFVNSKNL